MCLFFQVAELALQMVKLCNKESRQNADISAIKTKVEEVQKKTIKLQASADQWDHIKQDVELIREDTTKGKNQVQNFF